jgi:hypothetical protein
MAYRAGVVASISAPVSFGLISGLGTALSLGSTLGTQKGAVIQDVTALHVAVSPNAPYSVSTQIATLRRLLLHPIGGENGRMFEWVVNVSLLLSFSRAEAELSFREIFPL